MKGNCERSTASARYGIHADAIESWYTELDLPRSIDDVL